MNGKTTFDFVNAMPIVLGLARELEAVDRKTTYLGIARRVGWNEKWNRKLKADVEKLINMVSAVDYEANGESTINWNRIVNARTGLPGAGVNRQSRITRAASNGRGVHR
jgi:hypothetical protein